ncbi:MAG: glycosyltransferase family 9 protein [Desulfovibrio sp.]|jgi:heptosyltransferase-2|nr:glycosyltransferase family 9 protein [Desulfovibrio sp.]
MRIAVWNTAFLGDAVLTLPLIRSLRLRFPDAETDFYVRGGLEGLFRPHPDVGAVFGYAKGGRSPAGIVAQARRVAARRHDLWISAHGSFRSGVIAALSGARERIGYARPAWNRIFYTRTADRRFGELHEIERLLELLRPLGEGPLADWPEIALGPESARKAEDFFAHIPGPVLGMHPGSVWATKRWPAEYYAEIGARALAHGASVLLFAGKGEEALSQAVRAMISGRRGGRGVDDAGRLHDFGGRLPLPDLAAFLGRLSCYLGNDSGPMHLAWAQRRPVTAVFGPTVEKFGFFPRGEASTVIQKDLPCRPCGLHGPSACPLKHHRCMRDISPDEVWDDVRPKLLTRGKHDCLY